MQISDSHNQKNSLFNAMNRFIGAVNNMDQTVMVPNLLRDVPLGDGEDLKVPEYDATSTNRTTSNGRTYFHQDGDMYSSYVLLKSIRNNIEWGVLQGEDLPKDTVQEVVPPEVPKAQVEDDDLEKQFHFHLNGLHSILSKLTHKANTLTSRYKEEIGCRN